MNGTDFFGPGVKDQFPGLEAVDRTTELSFEDNEYYIMHHVDSENVSAPLFEFSDNFINEIKEIIASFEVTRTANL